MRLLPLSFLFFLLGAPTAAQELPDAGQSEAAFRERLTGKPAFQREVAALEHWLSAKGLRDIVPTYQVTRTASMWRACNGPPFEVPPRKHWRRIADTLRFVRDQVRRAVGPVEAASGYRNDALNSCAGGAAGSAHRDYSALDLIPLQPLTRRQLFDRICPLHRGKGPAHRVGLGFYAFQRFHIDTRRFRRWGSAGPRGNESPCAVLERGGDPEAPPLPPPSPALPPGRTAPSDPPLPALPPSPSLTLPNPGQQPSR